MAVYDDKRYAEWERAARIAIEVVEELSDDQREARGQRYLHHLMYSQFREGAPLELLADFYNMSVDDVASIINWYGGVCVAER